MQLNPSQSQTEAYRIVTEVLADSLALEEDEITPDSILVQDLGVESIDYLDIAFKLERRLRIPQLHPFGIDSTLVQYGSISPTGVYTKEGMKNVRTELRHFYDAMPESERELFERTQSPEVFRRNVNVRGLVAYVEQQLAQRPTTTPSS